MYFRHRVVAAIAHNITAAPLTIANTTMSLFMASLQLGDLATLRRHRVPERCGLPALGNIVVAPLPVAATILGKVDSESIGRQVV